MMSFNIEKLPKTLATYILTFIPVKEICNISIVNKYMNSLINDLFWTIKLLRLGIKIPKCNSLIRKDIYIWNKYFSNVMDIGWFDKMISIPKNLRAYHADIQGGVNDKVFMNMLYKYYGLSYKIPLVAQTKEDPKKPNWLKEYIMKSSKLNNDVKLYLCDNITSLFRYKGISSFYDLNLYQP